MATNVPTYREYSAEQLARMADKKFDKPADVYEFSNGRKFEDPEENGGAYKQP